MSEKSVIPSRLASPASYRSASSPSASLRARLDTMLLKAEIERTERNKEKEIEKKERQEDREGFRLFLASFLEQLGSRGELVVPEKSPPASPDAALFSLARKDTKIERRSADLEKPEPAEVSLRGTSQMEILMSDEAIVHHTQVAISDSPSNVLLK